MKSLKVFYNGKPLRNIYPHATKFQVFKYRVKRFFRKLAIATGAVLALYIALYAGKTFFPNVTYAVEEKQVEVVADSPVLDRIAKCESKSKHTDKNGQVLINATQDMGLYQINVPTWGHKATEMGLNLAVEKDNKAFAQWLYANYGTEPWSSSKHCWNNQN